MKGKRSFGGVPNFQHHPRAGWKSRVSIVAFLGGCPMVSHARRAYVGPVRIHYTGFQFEPNPQSVASGFV